MIYHKTKNHTNRTLFSCKAFNKDLTSSNNCGISLSISVSISDDKVPSNCLVISWTSSLHLIRDLHTKKNSSTLH